MTAQEVVFAVAGGGLLAPILVALIRSFYDVLENVAEFLFGFVVVKQRVSINGGQSTAAILEFLHGSYPEITSSRNAFEMVYQYIRPLKAKRKIWVKKTTWSWRIYWVGRWPVLFLPCAHSNRLLDEFLYVRGTVDFAAILRAVEDREDDRRNDREAKIKRFHVIRHFGSTESTVESIARSLSKNANQPPGFPDASDENETVGNLPLFWNREEIGENVDGSRLEDLSLNAELLDTVHRVKQWYKNKEWYREHGVPWRKGVGLFGSTGCGKSTIIRGVCEDLDIPCHVFDLASMSNEEFLTAWQEARDEGEARAVAFEDMDTVFNLREPVNPDSDLTFDTILNAVDGVQREDGLLLFMTTNYIDKIDAALGAPMKDEKGEYIRDSKGRLRSTRPGRIDIILEVKPLDLEGRLKLARRIVEDDVVAQKLAIDSEGETATQFQDKCVRVALDAREANE